MMVNRMKGTRKIRAGFTIDLMTCKNFVELMMNECAHISRIISVAQIGMSIDSIMESSESSTNNHLRHSAAQPLRDAVPSRVAHENDDHGRRSEIHSTVEEPVPTGQNDINWYQGNYRAITYLPTMFA